MSDTLVAEEQKSESKTELPNESDDPNLLNESDTPKPPDESDAPHPPDESDAPKPPDETVTPDETITPDLFDWPDTIAQTVIIPKGTIKRKQNFVVEIPYEYRDEPLVVVIKKEVEDPIRSHDPFIEQLEAEKAKEKPKIGSCKIKTCPINPNALGLNVADDKPPTIMECLQKCGPKGWELEPIESDEDQEGGSDKCSNKCRKKNKLKLCDDISQKPEVVDEGTNKSEAKEVTWDIKEDEDEEEEEGEEGTEEEEDETVEEPEEEENEDEEEEDEEESTISSSFEEV